MWNGTQQKTNIFYFLDGIYCRWNFERGNSSPFFVCVFESLFLFLSGCCDLNSKQQSLRRPIQRTTKLLFISCYINVLLLLYHLFFISFLCHTCTAHISHSLWKTKSCELWTYVFIGDCGHTQQQRFFTYCIEWSGGGDGFLFGFHHLLFMIYILLWLFSCCMVDHKFTTFFITLIMLLSLSFFMPLVLTRVWVVCKVIGLKHSGIFYSYILRRRFFDWC